MRVNRSFILMMVAVLLTTILIPIHTAHAASKKRLSAPAILSCENKNNSILIHWRGVKGANSYRIYKKEASNKKYKRVKTVGRNTRTIVDHKILPGKKYIYTVRAVDKKKKKLYLGNYIKSGITPIEAPVITGIAPSSAKASITWKKSSGAKGYILYYRKGTSGSWKRIGKTSKTKYTIKNYKAAYYYTVRAYKKVGKRTIYSNYDKKFTGKDRKYASKKVLFDGASTAYGSLKIGSRASVPFSKRCALLTGIHYKNIGVPGNTLTSLNQGSSLVERIITGKTHYQGYDVICINASTNDYTHSREIGGLPDLEYYEPTEELPAGEENKLPTEIKKKNKEGKPNVKTVYGALGFMIRTIKEQNPHAEIVLMTPQFCGKFGKKTGINAYAYKNKRGYTLNDYSKAVKEVAAYYQLHVYDAQKANIVNKSNYKTATGDYIHATQETYVKIGDSLTSFLLKNKIL